MRWTDKLAKYAVYAVVSASGCAFLLNFLGLSLIAKMVGMLIAIPCYTVLRVIAGRFFRNVKFVRRLISNDPSSYSPNRHRT